MLYLKRQKKIQNNIFENFRFKRFSILKIDGNEPIIFDCYQSKWSILISNINNLVLIDKNFW